MAFVVDGSDWVFEGWTNEAVVDAIENFLDRIHTAQSRRESVWVGEDFQSRQVIPGFDLWQLRSQRSPFTLPAEVWQELTAWLGRGGYYEDETDWPEGLDNPVLEVDGDLIEDNPDVTWAHHWVRTGRAMACLGLQRIGVRQTRSSLGQVRLHWVSDEESHVQFWQAALDVEGDDLDTLRRLAPHAYPSLYFHPTIWDGLNRFGGGYLTHRSEVRRHFAVFEMYGSWAFTCPSPVLSPAEIGEQRQGLPSNQLIERRFRGFNIDMAPENPDVFQNARCRRAREIELGDELLYCEWHAKIQPHQNRIHVYRPTRVSNGKFIVGVIDLHLELP